MLIARHVFFKINRKIAKSKHVIYEVLSEGTETTYQWLYGVFQAKLRAQYGIYTLESVC